MNYKTISEEASAKILEKKSSFTCYIFFFNKESSIQKFISLVSKKHKDACHIPYAYRYLDAKADIQEMYSDDGEPAKTAGYSALRVLQQKNIVNVCVIIARTFGGVKLGTSGLMRAFATSCERALDNAHIKSFVQKKSYSVVISPKNLGGVETFCKQKGLIYFIKPILTGSDTGKLRLTCMIKQDDILIQKEFNRIINTV